MMPPILSNVFGGGDDSESGNQNSSDFLADATSSGVVNLNYEGNRSETDEDGETESSSNSQSLSTDYDTDSMVNSMTENFSYSRSEDDGEGGGLLG